MKQSPLHDKNLELGARLTGFGDWEMPVQYRGVIAEHNTVREAAGWFDVSHLGRFELTGAGARQSVRSLLCNDIDRISPGRCQYTMILNTEGGIVDDLIVWWIDDGTFWILPNAANHYRVMAAFDAGPDTTVSDLRNATAMIAVQGPSARDALHAVIGEAPGRFRIVKAGWNRRTMWMAGTGYTGEPGAELCIDSDSAADLVDALTGAGVLPAGLGARDTLRLEAGLALWGEDIDETTTPLEAGLAPFVDFDHDFVGREALLSQRDFGVARRRVSFVLSDRGIPRHGHRLRSASGGEGAVTSGNMSPLLGKGIGLGYVAPAPLPDEHLEVEIRERWVPARQVQTPFHK